MIVPLMTPEEVYKELYADRENLSRWWLHKREELAKRALKQIKFPMLTWIEHTTPRKNRYLVLSVVLKRNYNNNSMTGVIALQKTNEGTLVYITRFVYQEVASKVVFLPHMFDRYGQRAAVKKQGIDLIKHFIYHNYMGRPTMDERFSGKSVRYKGRDNVCMSVPEGVLLGEKKDDIYIAHTFITYDDATGLQREEFEKKKEKLIVHEDLNKFVKGLYRNEYYNF